MKKRFSFDFRPGMRGIGRMLGNLESQVMDVIWDKACEVSVRDVYEEIACHRKIAYTTVMTIMGRLAGKEILKKTKRGNVSYFEPTMSRGEFTESMVGEVVDSLLTDFADATLAHFVSRVQGEDLATIAKLEKILAARRKNGDSNESE